MVLDAGWAHILEALDFHPCWNWSHPEKIEENLVRCLHCLEDFRTQSLEYCWNGHLVAPPPWVQERWLSHRSARWSEELPPGWRSGLVSVADGQLALEVRCPQQWETWSTLDVWRDSGLVLGPQTDDCERYPLPTSL